MNKYEKLIEHIINDNEQAARKLFHQIVVEKSRDIYESLMDEEMGGNASEEMVDEITNEVEMDEEGLAEEMEDEDSEEDFDLDSEEDHDSLAGDLPADDMDNDMGDEDLEDRVMDLETELEELKAEFDRLMADEKEEDHDLEDLDTEDDFDSEDEDEDFDMDSEEEDSEEELDESDDEEEELDESRFSAKKATGPMSQADVMREYVEKVRDFYKSDAAEGDKVGAPSADKKVSVNTKSVVAGKNDMGGSAKNLVRGDHNEAVDGKNIEEPRNEYAKGRGELPDAGKFKNVPGVKKSKLETGGKAYDKSHEHEGKLVGSDGSRPINKTGPIKGKVR